MTSFIDRKGICLGALAIALLATPAAAQEVEDIVVTAQRREENLQNVPIAVAAIGGEALIERGIGRPDNIGAVVSGLNVSRQGSGPQFFLRGVGTTGGQIGVDQAVSIFIDGVYQPSVASGNLELYDIQRMEVLKGPQGTLFGRNATGGVINIVTLDPTSTNSVRAEFGYGNYETVEAKFFGNVAYSDNVAQTLAVLYKNQNEGFGTNVFNGERANWTKTFAIRSKLKVDFSDRTSVVLSGDYSDQGGDLGQAFRPAETSYTIFSGPGWSHGYHDANSNITQGQTAENYGGAVTIKHEFDFATLTSISAYRHVGAVSDIDLDMGPGDFYQAQIVEKTDQYSQELQLSSQSGGSLVWTLGLYYLTADMGTKPLSQYGPLLQFFGLPGYPADAYALVGFNTQSVESMAAYGQATYKITDDTRITLGARYTRDKRKLKGQNYTAPFAAGEPLNIGSLTPYGPFVRDHDTASKPTWRIVLDHQLADDVMAYVGYNRGFKSGAYNDTDIYSPALKPETLDAFEGGLKSKLFDNRVRLNMAAFLYKYKDIQLSKFEGGTQQLLNAAKAEMYGLDADLEIAASRQLTVNAGMSLLHAEFESFPDGPVAVPNTSFPFGGVVNAADLSGQTVPKSPKFTANLGIDYRVPLAEGELGLNLTYAYNSGFFWEAANRTRQEAYSLVNGQIAWTSPDDHFTVKLWGRNLFDKKIHNFTVETAVGDISTPAEPRTYGFAIGFKY